MVGFHDDVQSISFFFDGFPNTEIFCPESFYIAIRIDSMISPKCIDMLILNLFASAKYKGQKFQSLFKVPPSFLYSI